MIKNRNLTIKEKILQTAEAMFVKKGFFPTTVEEIAKQAKIAKGTVYLYFPTKESIYLTIFENKFIGNEYFSLILFSAIIETGDKDIFSFMSDSKIINSGISKTLQKSLTASQLLSKSLE